MVSALGPCACAPWVSTRLQIASLFLCSVLQELSFQPNTPIFVLEVLVTQTKIYHADAVIPLVNVSDLDAVIMEETIDSEHSRRI